MKMKTLVETEEIDGIDKKADSTEQGMGGDNENKEWKSTDEEGWLKK